MDVYADSIRSLAPADKLRLVEQIWDDLAAEGSPIPLPDWALSEAKRRRDEMAADPDLGLTHEEVWELIDDSRHG